MRHTILYSAAIIAGAIALTVILRQLLLGGPYQLAVTPTSVPDQITQSIKGTRIREGVVNTGGTTRSGPALQSTGDYQVNNITYFEGRDWVVADLHPRETVNQTLVIIMRLDGSRYRIAMGPGTNFPRSALESISVPAGLINHLDERGLVSVVGG